MNVSKNTQSIQQLKRTYYLIISLFWFATGLPIALAILLKLARGLDLFQVSIWMGLYSLTIVLLEVPTGGLADAIGRKRVAIMAYSCITLSSIVFLFAFSFPMFLFLAVLYGAGRALSSGALEAWFVDALQASDPEVDLQPALAKANTFILLSLGLGLLLGSLIPRLFDKLPADGTAVLTPFSMPIVFAIVAQVVLLILTGVLVKEARTSAGGETWRQGFGEMPAIIRTGFTLSRRNPTIMMLMGTTLAGGLVLSSLESLWQPHFAHLLGGSEGNSLFFGLVMGGSFIIGIGGNLLVTPLSRFLNKRYGLLCAIFQGLRGLMLILLASQTTIPLAVAFFWLVYFNMGIINSPHTTLLNREIPARHRSAMLSIESLVGYSGAIIGSIGLGYMAEYVSIGTAWIFGGAVLVVSLWLYMKVDGYQKVMAHRPLANQEESYA